MATITKNMKKILAFEGLMAAPFTAFDNDGNVKEDVIPKYAKYLRDNDVHGVFVNGTTGESLSLNVDERKKIAEEWIKAGKQNYLNLVIIHISANCIKDTKEMARHAEDNDADAIALLPPVYFRPENNEQLINYIKEISNAAPNTPIIYYHIPSMSGVNINLNNFVKEARPNIPNFCGAKYTSSDLKDLAYCQANHGKDFKFMVGCDELFLASMSIGVNTAIGISHNIFPKENNNIIKYFKNNDMRNGLVEQMKLNNVLERMLKWGGIFPVLKAAMNIMTPINVGNTRPPLYPLSEKNLKGLQDEIIRTE